MPVPSPGCVNGLQTNVFIFDTSGHVHISFQAWKRGQGPWSLTHSLPVTLPTAICGIWNDSAWNLHAGSWVFAAVRHIQMKRISCQRALASELCLRDVLIIVFFPLLDICPAPSHHEEESLQLQETQRPIAVGVKSLPPTQGEFLHHREKHCRQNCSLEDCNYLQATINCGLGLITSRTDTHHAFKDFCCTIILHSSNLCNTASLLCLRSLKYVTCVFATCG